MLCEGYFSKLVVISQIPNTLAGAKNDLYVMQPTPSPYWSPQERDYSPLFLLTVLNSQNNRLNCCKWENRLTLFFYLFTSYTVPTLWSSEIFYIFRGNFYRAWNEEQTAYWNEGSSLYNTGILQVWQ